MIDNIEQLRTSLRSVGDAINDYDYICECRPVDVRAALAIIDRLPRDGSGKPVIPSVDRLFVPYWGEVGCSLTRKDSNGYNVPVRVDGCYTRRYDSREAAKAAERQTT